MNAETRRRMYQVLGVILFEKDTVIRKKGIPCLRNKNVSSGSTSKEEEREHSSRPGDEWLLKTVSQLRRGPAIALGGVRPFGRPRVRPLVSPMKVTAPWIASTPDCVWDWFGAYLLVFDEDIRSEMVSRFPITFIVTSCFIFSSESFCSSF